MPTQRAMKMGSSSPVKVRGVRIAFIWNFPLKNAKQPARQVRGVRWIPLVDFVDTFEKQLARQVCGVSFWGFISCVC